MLAEEVILPFSDAVSVGQALEVIRRLAATAVRQSGQGADLRAAREILENLIDAALQARYIRVSYNPITRDFAVTSDAEPLQRRVHDFGIEEFRDVRTIADRGYSVSADPRASRDRQGERLIAAYYGDNYRLDSICDGRRVSIAGTIGTDGKFRQSTAETDEPDGVRRTICFGPGPDITQSILRSLGYLEQGTISVYFNEDRVPYSDFSGKPTEEDKEVQSFNGRPITSRAYVIKRKRYEHGAPERSHIHVCGRKIPVAGWDHRNNESDFRMCIRADGANDFLTPEKMYSSERDENTPIEKVVERLLQKYHPEAPYHEPQTGTAAKAVRRAVGVLLGLIHAKFEGRVSFPIVEGEAQRKGDPKDNDIGYENPSGAPETFEPEIVIKKGFGGPGGKKRNTRRLWQWMYKIWNSPYQIKLLTGWSGQRYKVLGHVVQVYTDAPAYRSLVGPAKNTALSLVAFEAVFEALRANELKDIPNGEWDRMRRELLDEVSGVDYYSEAKRVDNGQG